MATAHDLNSNQPSITVRSMAQLLRANATKQTSILRKQKHSKVSPQKHVVHYYAKALTGIRQFYREGNDFAAIREARRAIDRIGFAPKRDNNNRLLDSFERNEKQICRKLRLQSNTRFKGSVSNLVELRLSADIRGTEEKHERYIFYNYRKEALSAVVAEDTLAVAHWLLLQNGIEVPVSALEFVDLFTGRIYVLSRPRPGIAATLTDTGKIIRDMWPII